MFWSVCSVSRLDASANGLIRFWVDTGLTRDVAEPAGDHCR